MKEEEVLTPAEVADQLKIAKNTVYELIKRGELEAYRVGKKIRVECQAVEALKKKRRNNTAAEIASSTENSAPRERGKESSGHELIICGQDVILDILAQRLEEDPRGFRVFRSHMGSYNALHSLYLGEVQIATAHMWDSRTDSYNIPYVRNMLPGMDTVVIHLVKRYQGFYVKRGNPKGISGWEDLLREDIRLINRERGSGTRILLDEYLQSRGWEPGRIIGYEEESSSHMACASRVGRGEADVALGCEKTAMQVASIEFIPMKEESYDMIFYHRDMEKPSFRAVLEILRDQAFQREIEGLGGYDISHMGKQIFPA